MRALTLSCAAVALLLGGCATAGSETTIARVVDSSSSAPVTQTGTPVALAPVIAREWTTDVTIRVGQAVAWPSLPGAAYTIELSTEQPQTVLVHQPDETSAAGALGLAPGIAHVSFTDVDPTGANTRPLGEVTITVLP